MKIVICDTVEWAHRNMDYEIAYFKKEFGEDVEIVVYEFNYEPEKLDEIKEVLSDADGVIVSMLHLNEDLIKAMHKCRGISIQATGFNSVDLKASAEAGIWVSSITDYCSQEVADHCMALLLTVGRKIKHYTNDIEKRGEYQFMTTSGILRLEGATLGILGFGRIGKSIAKRAQGFGLNIKVNCLDFTPEMEQELGVTYATPDEIYATSDFIVSILPLTEQTAHIINHEAFAKMAKCPVFINVGRGGLVDDVALVDALDNGLISGAGLDVLEVETIEYVMETTLAGRDNVVLTPHSAFYSETSILEANRIAAENLVNMIKGDFDKVERVVSKGFR